MRTYLFRRVFLLVPVVLGVSTLVFFFIHMIPGDPVDVMLGESARIEDREALRADLHLNEPIGAQYARYLGGLLRGDLGYSLASRRPVFQSVLERFPATLELAAAAMLLALTVALPLGILSAVRHRSAVDRGSLLFALIGVSMPNFWLGPLLILLFSIKLGALPVSGRGGLSHLILPAVTLGLAMSGILTRMIRSSLLEVIQKEYVLAAKAKGLSFRTVIVKHAFRNALVPIVTVLGLQAASLLAGAIITETIFAWPGIGRLTIQAIASRDYPLVQGCVLLIAVTTAVVNLVADLLYGAVDPRIRHASR